MNGLGGIIILVIVVGGWVIKAISAANESKQKKANPPERSGQPRVDYEQLAERRREELQQQAQQRRAQQGRGQQTQAQAPQRDPATMSMAERIEMARQRSAQQRGGGPQVDAQAEALRQARQDAEREAQTHAQAQAERARQEQQARQQQARQQQQRKLQQQQRQQQSRRRRSSQSASATKPAKRELSHIAEDAKRKHQQSHDRVLSKQGARAARLQEAKGSGGTQSAKALLDFSKLNRRSLRQAIVLKEILDAPVALRDNPRY